MTIRFDSDADPATVITWRCHNCAATGTDADGLTAATHISTDTPCVRTYLRPHCPNCLSPGQSEGALELVLRAAVDAGEVRAAVTYGVPCPVCGTRVAEDLATWRPVYAVAADQDESVCLACDERVPAAVVTEAYRRRARGLSPMWATASA
ncbi:hypothetical protein ABZ682_22915 [Streptomyces griseoviridis]|uniref:hypothetical protein n=1 Tax=Streptomyces griseoviridis TaxID=45398 RepID=UPI0033C4C682